MILEKSEEVFLAIGREQERVDFEAEFAEGCVGGGKDRVAFPGVFACVFGYGEVGFEDGEVEGAEFCGD